MLILLLLLTVSLAASASCAAGGEEIVVMTHYCPWYEPVDGKWQDGITYMPLLGLYLSTDPAVIGQHIQWANSYGVDCFVVEWTGLKNQFYNNNLKAILQHPDSGHMKFSLVYAVSMALGTVWEQSEQGIPPSECDWSVNCSDPLVRNKFLQDISYAAANYLWRDNFLKIRGKPAFYIWASAAMEGDVVGMIQAARERAASKYGLEIYFIGEEVSWFSVPEPSRMRAFDAVMPYAMLNLSVPSWETYQLDESIDGILARYAGWRNACEDLNIDFIPSVMPGYDDKNRTLYYTLINGTLDTPAPVAERSPESFRELCSRVHDLIDPEVRTVFVTSWNEWFEGTTVEPSVHYGFDYLEIINETLLMYSGSTREQHRLGFSFSQTARPADIYPGSTDFRDLAVAFDYIEFLDINRVPIQRIDAGTSDARPRMGMGWFGDEEEGDLGIDFVWAGGADAFASIYAQVPEPSVYIRVRATPLVAYTSATLSVGGRLVGNLVLDPGWAEYDLLLCPSLVELDVGQPSITIQSSVNITGSSLEPLGSILLHYREGSGPWQGLANVTSDAGGRFWTMWTPPSAAEYQIMATTIWVGAKTGLASPVVGLSVLKHGRTIDASVTPSVGLGSTAQVHGFIRPPEEGIGIVLTITTPDGSSQTRTLTTGADGAFTADVAASTVGLWRVVVTCPEDAIHNETERSYSFMVTKLASSITLAILLPVAEIGQSVNVSGQLSPPIADATVSLVFTDPLGSRHGMSADTDGRGRFSLSFRPWHLGVWDSVAESRGTAEYLGSRSSSSRFEIGQESATPIERFVYFDPNLATMWIAPGEARVYRDYLVGNGFEEVDSGGLRGLMERGGPNTVVVMAQDVVPDTVASQHGDSVIREYLEIGGTVIWMRDIPFYYLGSSDGSVLEWGTEGAATVLEVSIAGWEEQGEVAISVEGQEAGLTRTWISSRPVPREEVTKVLAGVDGMAAAWLKNFCPLVPESGFIRLWDSEGEFLSNDHLADLLCVSGTPATGPLQPIADFTFHPQNPGPGDEMSFVDLSRDLDGAVVGWLWEFGDGSVSQLPNPFHSYAVPDTYNLTLTVYDDSGQIGVVSRSLIVGHRPLHEICAAMVALLLRCFRIRGPRLKAARPWVSAGHDLPRVCIPLRS